MAPSCVALWNDTLISERRSHALPWTVGAPRGGAQPVRAGRTALDDERGVCSSPAVTALHAGLGPKLGVALPAFWGRGAPADQVDSLLRFGSCHGVPDRHGSLTTLPGRDLVRRKLPGMVASSTDCGTAELDGDPDRGGFRRPKVPPLRDRSSHQPCA